MCVIFSNFDIISSSVTKDEQNQPERFQRYGHLLPCAQQDSFHTIFSCLRKLLCTVAKSGKNISDICYNGPFLATYAKLAKVQIQKSFYL